MVFKRVMDKNERLFGLGFKYKNKSIIEYESEKKDPTTFTSSYRNP